MELITETAGGITTQTLTLRGHADYDAHENEFMAAMDELGNGIDPVDIISIEFVLKFRAK